MLAAKASQLKALGQGCLRSYSLPCPEWPAETHGGHGAAPGLRVRQGCGAVWGPELLRNQAEAAVPQSLGLPQRPLNKSLAGTSPAPALHLGNPPPNIPQGQTLFWDSL